MPPRRDLFHQTRNCLSRLTPLLFYLFWLWLAAVPSFAQADRCRVSPEEMQQPNSSRLLVQLILQNGKPLATVAEARLRLTEKFCAVYACRKDADGTLLPVDGALLASFVRRLNATLRQFRYFDEEASDVLFPLDPLTPPQEPLADAGPEAGETFQRLLKEYNEKKALLDKLRNALVQLEQTKQLRAYQGDFAPFFIGTPTSEPPRLALLNQWRQAVLDSPAVKSAFEEFWRVNGEADREFSLAESRPTPTNSFQVLENADAPASLFKSALRLILRDETPDTNYPEGVLCFRVNDPLASTNLSVTPAEEKPLVTAALAEAHLTGQPWTQEEIRAALTDFYADKGQAATFEIDDAQRTVAVQRRRINFFRLPKTDTAERNRLLQRLLSRSEFYELMRVEQAASGPKYLRPAAADEPDAGGVSLGLRPATEADETGEFRRLAVRPALLHHNAFLAQRIGAALQEVDYTWTSTNSDGSNAGFINQTLSPIPKTTSGRLNEHPSLRSFLDATLYQLCPPNHNYFYGGLEYRPGQGVRGLGGYKCLSVGPGNLSVEAGGNGAAIGRISYAGVIPFFGTGPGGALRRPLFLQIEGASLYERNRLFGGVLTNERRSGVMVRAVLPLFTPAETEQFDLLAEAKRQTVDLLRDAKTVDKLNLTTLELGARYFLDRRAAQRPATLEFVPRLKLGLGAAAREPRFALLNLSGSFHQETSRWFELDFKGRANLASRATPYFELPSFGGAETARGFREDDALGRRLWSLQPELWLRARALVAPQFDPVTGGLSKWRKLVRDSFALALFADVARVHRTFNSLPGTRYGPGLGLRFKYAKQATLRLDWAYGVGDGVSGRGRSRFYFSFDLLENPF